MDETCYFEALRSKGSTGKNPPVGCVIVKNGNIISSGRTSFQVDLMLKKMQLITLKIKKI